MPTTEPPAAEQPAGQSAGVRAATPGEDLQAYWDNRLSEDFSLNVTGFGGLGEGFNRWSYRLQRRVFRRLAKPRARPDSKVLDVGSGVGFWIQRWRELGVGSITGSDLTAKSVSMLSERYPDHRIVQVDIGGEDLSGLEPESFDLISAISVLYHIPEDEPWKRSFRNLHSLLRPGGSLIFNDNFVDDGAYRNPDQAVRLGSEIEAAVKDAGFEIVERRPMSFFMNNPVRSHSRIHKAFWIYLCALLRRSELFGKVAGALLYPVDLALVSLLKRGPSSEMVVCRKRG